MLLTHVDLIGDSSFPRPPPSLIRRRVVALVTLLLQMCSWSTKLWTKLPRSKLFRYCFADCLEIFRIYALDYNDIHNEQKKFTGKE